MQQYVTMKLEAGTPLWNTGRPFPFRRALGGMLTAIMLLPVPVFAFTWATSGTYMSWTAVGTPQNISSFGESMTSSDWLNITATTAGQTTSITLARDFLPGSGNPAMLAQVGLGDAGLQLQSGGSMQLEVWTTVSGQTSPKSDIISLQSPNGPQSLNNQFTTNINQLQTGTQYTLNVSFTLTGAWTMPSTPYTVVTKFSD